MDYHRAMILTNTETVTFCFWAVKICLKKVLQKHVVAIPRKHLYYTTTSACHTYIIPQQMPAIPTKHLYYTTGACHTYKAPTLYHRCLPYLQSTYIIPQQIPTLYNRCLSYLQSTYIIYHNRCLPYLPKHITRG